MAALGEQHGRGLILPPPVAADIAVSKMPIRDVLVVLYGHDVAERAAVYHLLYAAVIGRITEHMAHQHPRPFFARLFLYRERLFDEGTDRLFEDEVIAQIERAHGVPVMVAVLRGDDHGVRDLALREKRLVVGEAATLGHSPRIFDLVHLGTKFVADRNYPHAGIAGQMPAVILASAAETQHRYPDHSLPQSCAPHRGRAR